MSFPILPRYQYSWRSLLSEPVPLSGERISVGIIVKGENSGWTEAKALPKVQFAKFYERDFATRLYEAVDLCIRYAEKHYRVNPLSTSWTPPLEGFHLSGIQSSVAENADKAVHQAAMDCSSVSFSMAVDKTTERSYRGISAPESWRRRILEVVSVEKEALTPCFGRSVRVAGSDASLKLGFLSSNYAAQFDAVGDLRQFQRSLHRFQSKLWQLDCFRYEEGLLFRPSVYELVVERPATRNGSEIVAVNAFLNKLRHEASRRNIGLYAAESPLDAARHLIEQAA